VDPLKVRRRFAGRLTGHGVEIGPGHVPFPVPETVTVSYVDRWEPTENSALFPELGESPGFPKPDIVSNLDVDLLGALADESQDFVIASHIIEHLANPLAMLVDIHRVLRAGGLLILVVPDRHVTFDRSRQPTPLVHLIDEYAHDVREVDDTHVKEYLVSRQMDDDANGSHASIHDLTVENIALHRRRSVHAHVWDIDEFLQLLDYAALELGVRWRVIDTMKPGARGTHGIEFGWLLARDPDEGLETVGRQRPRALWSRSLYRSARGS